MLAVAFEACACRASFHIGVAEWMAERGVNPSIAAGASSGSIVAAAVRLQKLPDLRSGWLEMMAERRPFVPSAILKAQWPGRMTHILRDALVPRHGQIRMEEVPGLRIAVTRLELSGPRPVILDQHTDARVVDAILGSCFIPGPYSTPVSIEGHWVVDGGWHWRVPVHAIDGPGIAVVSGFPGEILKGWPFGKAVEPEPNIRVLAPIEELPIDGFTFCEEGSRAAMEIGHRSAERFFRENEAWLTEHIESPSGLV